MTFDAFLLSLDTTQMSREEVINFVDQIPEVVNWMAFLPASICVVSGLSAKDLSRVVRSRLPELRFIIVRAEKGQRQGWLPKSAWEFIKEPRPAENRTAAE